MAAPLDPVVEAPRLVPLTEPPLVLGIARERPVAAQVLLALWRSLWKRQGVLPAGGAPALVATRELVTVDPGRVEAYRDVCGYPRGPAVPVAYPELLFHPLLVEIALAPAFPFSPLGLVHVRQRIRRARPLDPGERLDLRCTLAEVRGTGRGFEVDCAMVVDAAGGVAWEGVTTLLSRARTGRGRGLPRPAGEPSEGALSVEVEVPADTGRRYAAVSGDWNLHHVSTLAARLLGFRAPIAHGMWTLARTLAAAGTRWPEAPACAVDVAFRRPVLLPGRIALRLSDAPPGGIRLEARDPVSGAPHLTGEITPAAAPAG